ncbi:MAG: DUF979 domain-containing protein [Bryobacterales bacterium]|nr:DUF979 domain-containing protein [Bryobacterales bacterium]MBV9400125.1 DUF979 domain-containing protein [Bryobacterales bacterium]
MISLEAVYVIAGVTFGAFAAAAALNRLHPKRFANAAFYGLLAISFLFGSKLSDFANGILALGLIVVGGAWRTGRGPVKTTSDAERAERASRYKSFLFVPALIAPFSAFAGSTVLKNLSLGGKPLVDPQAATLVWLFAGIMVGLALTMVAFRPPLLAPVTEGGRLVDTIGWALLLPQMLAALGSVFTVSGVGTAVGRVFSTYAPITTPRTAVVVFGLGMVAFTIIMGNAFAAFPVMMAALGLPLVVQRFGANVVAVSALGMLTGFCGTLLTPMAANFNLVPATLLELDDRYAVIRAQAPTALLLMAGNLLLLCLLVYR